MGGLVDREERGEMIMWIWVGRGLRQLQMLGLKGVCLVSSDVVRDVCIGLDWLSDGRGCCTSDDEIGVIVFCVGVNAWIGMGSRDVE